MLGFFKKEASHKKTLKMEIIRVFEQIAFICSDSLSKSILEASLEVSGGNRIEWFNYKKENLTLVVFFKNENLSVLKMEGLPKPMCDRIPNDDEHINYYSDIIFTFNADTSFEYMQPQHYGLNKERIDFNEKVQTISKDDWEAYINFLDKKILDAKSVIDRWKNERLEREMARAKIAAQKKTELDNFLNQGV